MLSRLRCCSAISTILTMMSVSGLMRRLAAAGIMLFARVHAVILKLAVLTAACTGGTTPTR